MVVWIDALADKKDEGRKELAKGVPNAVGQDHCAADVAWGPFSYVDGKGRLQGADADTGKYLSRRPVLPVTDCRLEGDRLCFPLARSLDNFGDVRDLRQPERSREHTWSSFDLLHQTRV